MTVSQRGLIVEPLADTNVPRRVFSHEISVPSEKLCSTPPVLNFPYRSVWSTMLSL